MIMLVALLALSAGTGLLVLPVGAAVKRLADASMPARIRMLRAMGAGVGPVLLLGWQAAPCDLHAQHVHSAVVTGVSGSPSASAPVLPKPPVIDGRMEPGEWDLASRHADFVQTEPAEGEPETERTEVWIARGEAHLYLAFVAYDSEIGRVRADLTPRDRLDSSADVVGVLIDPLQTRSRGYFFFFNPLGVQYDGTWSRDRDLGWDGVLESRGSIEADRYVVEVAIPFATMLAGGQSRSEWDVNFFRQIPRRGEESWWSPVPRAGKRSVFSHAGQLSGMSEAGPGARLEVIPTVTAQAAGARGAEGSGEATWGATARLSVTPTIRAEATFRPDFSFVESDDAQITFNERYALFYPEKRPFFLEGKDRFETPGASFVSDPLRLVHTRTIVHPRYGARLLATPDGGFVGAMIAAEEGLDGALDGTSAVVRAKLEGEGGTQAGLVATRRDRAAGSNTVLAADAQVGLPARVVLTLQAARSVSRDDSTGATRYGTATYVDLARETGSSFQQIVYRKVEREFETELGFIPRSDLQQVVSHVGVYWRPGAGALLYALPMIQHVVSFDDAGRRTDIEYLPHLELQFTRQTTLWLGYRLSEELYRGRSHGQARFEPRLSTAPAPWLGLSVGGKLGRRIRYDSENTDRDDTFSASYREANASAELRIGPATTLSASAVWRRLGGNEDVAPREIWLGRLRAAYHLSNTTYLRLVAQYDPDQERREGSLLLGHELNYGTQLHLGVDYGSAADAPDGARTDRGHAFVRVSYLFRR